MVSFSILKLFLCNPKKEALEPCSGWTKMREILLKALRVPLTWILVFFFFTVLCVFLLKKQASKARLSTWKSMLLPGKRGQKLSISVLHVIFWGHQTKHWTGFFLSSEIIHAFYTCKIFRIFSLSFPFFLRAGYLFPFCFLFFVFGFQNCKLLHFYSHFCPDFCVPLSYHSNKDNIWWSVFLKKSSLGML